MNHSSKNTSSLTDSSLTTKLDIDEQAFASKGSKPDKTTAVSMTTNTQLHSAKEHITTKDRITRDTEIQRGSSFSSESTDVIDLSFTSDDASFSLSSSMIEKDGITKIYLEDSVLQNFAEGSSNESDSPLSWLRHSQFDDDECSKTEKEYKESHLTPRLKRLKVKKDHAFDIFRPSKRSNAFDASRPFNIYTDAISDSHLSSNGNSSNSLNDLVKYLSSSGECSAANPFQRAANKNITKLFKDDLIAPTKSSENFVIHFSETKDSGVTPMNGKKSLTLGIIDDRLLEVFRHRNEIQDTKTPVKTSKETFNIYTDARQDCEVNERGLNHKLSERALSFTASERKRSSLSVLKSPPGTRTPLGRIQNSSQSKLNSNNSIKKSKIAKQLNMGPPVSKSRPLASMDSDNKPLEKENVGCS